MSTTNQPINANDRPNLHHVRARRKYTPKMLRTNATFCPDTAVRCDNPAPRNALIMVRDCARSSPITSPMNNADSSRGITSAARLIVDRRRLALRANGDAANICSRTSLTENMPTMWRGAYRITLACGTRDRCPETNNMFPASACAILRPATECASAR